MHKIKFHELVLIRGGRETSVEIDKRSIKCIFEHVILILGIIEGLRLPKRVENQSIFAHIITKGLTASHHIHITEMLITCTKRHESNAALYNTVI